MIRVFLSGCLGRMGRTIASIAAASDDLRIVAGSDARIPEQHDFPVFTHPVDCDIPFDVLIDFSSPAALPGLIDLIRARHCPAVICTTGLSDQQKAELDTLAAVAPIFISANMSLGINILVDLARQAAALLYPEFNIEIIEAHHNQKVDAPSGTALLLAEQIRDRLDDPDLNFVYDRSTRREKRPDREIGIHAVRGGGIVGDHTIVLAGPEETIELSHHAHSRAVFARGALAAARFLVGQQPGCYSMSDLLRRG